MRRYFKVLQCCVSKCSSRLVDPDMTGQNPWRHEFYILPPPALQRVAYMATAALNITRGIRIGLRSASCLILG